VRKVLLREGSTSNEPEAALKRIARVGDIMAVGRIDPDRTTGPAALMCYARIKDDADVGVVVKKILSLPEVDTVSVAPQPASLCARRFC
jgi:hypothetical protein